MKRLISTLLTSGYLISVIAVSPSSSAANTPEVVWASSATATTHYTGYDASFAAGAPDATQCGDYSGQAWTYGSPYTGSQLTVDFAEPVFGEELVVYFSYELVDTLRIEIQYEGSEDFYLFSDIAEDYSCSENADSEYPNDIKVTRSLNAVSAITAVRFTALTDEGYPEIDAVGLVKEVYTKPVFTIKPTVYGKATVGRTIGSGVDARANPLASFNYQWFACTKSGSKFESKKPADCSAISGATNVELKLKKAQKGKYIRLRVIIENSVGSKTLFSKTTAKVS